MMYDNNINKKRKVNQFDIWMADIPKTDERSHIQCGKRPVVVVSGKDCNNNSPVFTILTFTKQNKNNLPCHVRIEDYEKYGLKMPSTVMGESISPCNEYWLHHKMGEIKDKNVQNKVIRAMNAHLGICS